MYFDLSIPWPARSSAHAASGQSKKHKGKSKAVAAPESVSHVTALKSGIDVLSPQDRRELRRSVEMAIHCQLLSPPFDRSSGPPSDQLTGKGFHFLG
jgi:hypothetical protein